MGELPRAVTLIADRHLVGRVAPGTRVTITGIYSIYQAESPPQPASAPSLHRQWSNAGPWPGREAPSPSAAEVVSGCPAVDSVEYSVFGGRLM